MNPLKSSQLKIASIASMSFYPRTSKIAVYNASYIFTFISFTSTVIFEKLCICEDKKEL